MIMFIRSSFQLQRQQLSPQRKSRSQISKRVIEYYGPTLWASYFSPLLDLLWDVMVRPTKRINEPERIASDVSVAPLHDKANQIKMRSLFGRPVITLISRNCRSHPLIANSNWPHFFHYGNTESKAGLRTGRNGGMGKPSDKLVPGATQ